MSDELIKSLNAQVQKYQSEAADHKRRAVKAGRERDEYKGQLDKLTKERDDALAELAKRGDEINALKQQVKDAPSRHAEENKALKAQILQGKRRSAFEKAAKGKIRDDAIEDAFERFQWGESEDIDEATLGSEVDRLITAKPYLKPGPQGPEAAPGGPGQSERGGTSQSTLTPRPPGPGSDRGAAPGKAPEAPKFGGRIA